MIGDTPIPQSHSYYSIFHRKWYTEIVPQRNLNSQPRDFQEFPLNFDEYKNNVAIVGYRIR